MFNKKIKFQKEGFLRNEFEERTVFDEFKLLGKTFLSLLTFSIIVLGGSCLLTFIFIRILYFMNIL